METKVKKDVLDEIFAKVVVIIPDSEKVGHTRIQHRLCAGDNDVIEDLEEGIKLLHCVCIEIIL